MQKDYIISLTDMENSSIRSEELRQGDYVRLDTSLSQEASSSSLISLQITEQNSLSRQPSLIIHSSKGNSTMQTMIRFSTPKKSRSVRKSPYLKRPSSSRTLKKHEETDPSALLNRIYSSMTLRSKPGLSSSSKKEIKQICISKSKELQSVIESTRAQTPMQITTREKFRIYNQETDMKIQRIRKQKFEEEMARLKQSNLIYQKSQGHLAAKEEANRIKKLHFEQGLTRYNQLKEMENLASQEQKLVIENVYNYMNDRIQMAKDNVQTAREMKNSLVKERKKYLMF